MTDAEYKAFLDAWSNYPSQDNEGYQPDRGSFKSGFFAGVEYMKAENQRLREALLVCISRAGAPDAAHGCRLIIETARAALENK
jgi:hypothetical protein